MEEEEKEEEDASRERGKTGGGREDEAKERWRKNNQTVLKETEEEEMEMECIATTHKSDCFTHTLYRYTSIFISACNISKYMHVIHIYSKHRAQIYLRCTNKQLFL